MEFDYITQGDCLELMKEIPDGSIDMILCDLPYGTTACKWDVIIPFEPLWEQYKRIIKDNGAIVLFGSEPFSTLLRSSNLKMYRYDWIWEKEQGANFMNCKYQPYKVHETISVFSKKAHHYYPQMTEGKPYISGKGTSGDITKNVIKTQTINAGTRYPRSIIKFNTDKRKSLHPTQKPVALLEYLIKTYTNEGDIVLDNCMGSGSTCVAAVNTGRHYIGFELDEKYFDIACQRLDEAENKKKIFDQEAKEAEQ
jgi:site-specific DNA-methyltransferase (adenine-specific)